jgi:hypothetical protein
MDVGAIDRNREGLVMQDPQPLLPHLPFFEALAAMDESSAEWRETSAGLVTLRLFDAWILEGPSVVAADALGHRAVRDAIDAVDVGRPTRAILGSIVDTMTQSPLVRTATVAPRLLAYARALQFDARWALAADVHRTVIAHAHPVEDAEIVIAANFQLGSCLRTLAQWEDATAAYSTAGCIAALTDDMVGVLRARIAEANIAIDRGNLPLAERMLDDTIRRADEHQLPEVRASALHDRAAVAIHRGDYELAVQLGYEALEGMRSEIERDRTLNEIAAAFYQLGLRSAARDAYLILAATAQEQYVRWAAMINLMECAAADGSELTFEQYRRELEGIDLPATLAAHYHLFVGQGYRLFAKFEAARAALELAREIASRHGVNEVLFKAEEALEEVRDGGVIIIAKAAEPSTEVAEVASAVRRMRELAGVPG